MQTNNGNKNGGDVSIKITALQTQENRLIVLPSASYTQLVQKVRARFNISDPINLHYIDDEGDHVNMSSDEELACAISLMSGVRPLRLFLEAPVSPAVKLSSGGDAHQAAPKNAEGMELIDQQQPADPLAALKQKLGDGHGFSDKRLTNVLQRLDGDVDKAAVRLLRRQTQQQNTDIDIEQLLTQLDAKGFGGNEMKRKRNVRLLKKFNGDVAQVEALLIERKQQAEAKKSAKHSNSDDCDGTAGLIPLLAQLDLKGFGGNEVKERRNARLLKKFDGDVTQVEAFLQARREQFMARKQAAQAGQEAAFAPLLVQLDQKGFGGSDIKRRRNMRLLNKFDGDVAQVEAVLIARRNKVITQIPAECEAPLAQLDEKGLGGDEMKRKRNVRLLKRFGGDVSKVEAFLETRRAEKTALTELEPLLSQLDEKGFGGNEVKKRRNARLLRKFDGDVAKVEVLLIARQQRCGAGKDKQCASAALSAC